MRPRTTAHGVLAAAALLAGCGGEQDAPGPAAVRAPASADAAAPAPAPAGPAEPAPEVVLEPAWPRGWKLVERGRAGAAAAPVAWFRLEAAGAAPEAAARAALDALRPFAGAVQIEDVVASRLEPRAVAHLRASRLSGVIEARAAKDGTEVRVTVEPTP